MMQSLGIRILQHTNRDVNSVQFFSLEMKIDLMSHKHCLAWTFYWLIEERLRGIVVQRERPTYLVYHVLLSGPVA